MLDNKLKIVITENSDVKLVEAGLIRIKYPWGATEDVVILEKSTYKKIISCLNIVHKIDPEFTIRLILTSGDCFFSIDEIPTTNMHVVWDLKQFLEKHEYIKTIYNKHLESQEDSIIQKILAQKNDEDKTFEF